MPSGQEKSVIDHDLETGINADFELIPLHGKRGEGKFAKVSPEDYEWAQSHRWYVSSTGYAVRFAETGERTKTRFMHHDLLPVEKGFIRDHINQDRLDNRRSNLRSVTQMQNTWNSPKQSTNENALTKSQYKGVKLNFKSNTWNVRITVGKKTYPLGGYPTEDEAARAYDAAARYYFGEFASLNFNEEGEALSAPQVLKLNVAQRGFTSNFVGVYWNKKAGKWYGRAYITRDQEIYLGLFPSEKDAAKAVDEALASQGLPRPNFPNDTTPAGASPRKQKASKYRGVTWHKKSQKWYVTVAIQGKSKHVGVASTEEEAARMADDARVANGQARVNFPS